MVATNRTCPICRKYFVSNANFTVHLNRKTPCITPELSAILGPHPKNFKCNRCDLLFQTNQKLTAHLNRRTPCKLKPTDDQLLVEQLQIENLDQKKIIEKLQSERQLTTNNNTTNNTTNNNTTNNNNIHIHVSGKEDLSHITDSMYKDCFCEPHKSIEKLFAMIHFHTNQPLNHNLYISNLDTGHITLLNKSGWVKASKDVEFERRYYDIKEILIVAFDIMRTAVPKTITSSLEKYFSPFVDDYIEEEFENQIKQASCEMMKYMAYNNRQEPMRIQKVMESL